MDPTQLEPILEWLAGAVSNTANVAWMQALVAGAVGAWAGSWATQRTINRHEDLNAARAELRATNHAINLCFTITNHYLGYKKQMNHPMLQRFKDLEARVRKQIADSEREIRLDLDFLILPTSELPIEQLQRIVLDKLPMGGRGLVAAMQLQGAHQALNDNLKERRSLIGAVQGSGLGGRKLSEFYLGIPDPDGNVDHRFHDNVHAIAQLADDCLFFSTIVAKDLHKHGVALLGKHGRSLGTKRRSITKWNWDEKLDDLMPKDEEYLDWLKGFPDPTPWWKFWPKKQN